jgi:surface protein
VSNKRDLKAYVRYDVLKRAVPGSNIFSKYIPKIGDWEEIPAYKCCTTNTTTAAPIPFISVWRTTSPDESVTLPYNLGGVYVGTIDWGDGTVTANSYANRTHTYAVPGDYTITISGTTRGWSFDVHGGDPTKMISVSQWGNRFRLGNDGGYFSGCSNLDLSGVTDILDLTAASNLSFMFFGCSSLTTVNRINEWNVSNVTNMEGVFYDATQFNQNISGWNTSSVTNMTSMFRNASLFNQNIGGWDTSSVTTMESMFLDASSFNQDVSGWDTSSVLNMRQMFDNSIFNQPIGIWDVSNVTNMSLMFNSTPFNQSIGVWNTVDVTNMSGMFSNTPFNQNISGWDVSNVFNMGQMFQNATAFNQDLSGWCVTNIPSTPTDFATGATAWVLPKPVWGTCPP